jgi:hypothetical protein
VREAVREIVAGGEHSSPTCHVNCGLSHLPLPPPSPASLSHLSRELRPLPPPSSRLPLPPPSPTSLSRLPLPPPSPASHYHSPPPPTVPAVCASTVPAVCVDGRRGRGAQELDVSENHIGGTEGSLCRLSLASYIMEKHNRLTLLNLQVRSHCAWLQRGVGTHPFLSLTPSA